MGADELEEGRGIDGGGIAPYLLGPWLCYALRRYVPSPRPATACSPAGRALSLSIPLFFLIGYSDS